MGAALQRAEDHFIECAPRSLGQIDVLPTEQLAKRSMQHDPADGPDLNFVSACLSHRRHGAHLDSDDHNRF
jgi:hypothetical protein